MYCRTNGHWCWYVHIKYVLTWNSKAREAHSQDQECNGDTSGVWEAHHQQQGGLHPKPWITWSRLQWNKDGGWVSYEEIMGTSVLRSSSFLQKAVSPISWHKWCNSWILLHFTSVLILNWSSKINKGVSGWRWLSIPRTKLLITLTKHSPSLN